MTTFALLVLLWGASTVGALPEESSAEFAAAPIAPAPTPAPMPAPTPAPTSAPTPELLTRKLQGHGGELTVHADEELYGDGDGHAVLYEEPRAASTGSELKELTHASKEAIKETKREVLKEPDEHKEVPSEGSENDVADALKKFTKEARKIETTEEALKEFTTEAPKKETTEAPKEETTESPKAQNKEAPKGETTDDHGGSESKEEEAPTSLSYKSGYNEFSNCVASEALASVGTALRGQVRFDISPALPKGIKLDPKTGSISGTYEKELPTRHYAFIRDGKFLVTTTKGEKKTTAAFQMKIVVGHCHDSDLALSFTSLQKSIHALIQHPDASHLLAIAKVAKAGGLPVELALAVPTALLLYWSFLLCSLYCRHREEDSTVPAPAPRSSSKDSMEGGPYSYTQLKGPVETQPVQASGQPESTP